MAGANDLLAESLVKIRNMPEFAPFRDHLAFRLKEATKVLVGSNDDRQMVLAQGGVRELTMLTELIERSAERLGGPR